MTSTSPSRAGEGGTTVLDILVAARALIEKPENWLARCPSPYEENTEGKRCASRAIWTLGERGNAATQAAASDAYKALAAVMGVERVPEWNDTHTHAEVLAAFDRAIEAAS